MIGGRNWVNQGLRWMCPHCGEIFDTLTKQRKIYHHLYEDEKCPGVGQCPRSPGDLRPLWKDGGVQ